MGLFYLLLIIASVSAVLLFFHFIFDVTEQGFGLLYNKPLFVHFYWITKTLDPDKSYILYKKFPYFNSLTDKEKRYFEHRVARFIDTYDFIGKEDFLITDEVKVLIAATSTMLTFGMRNYLYTVIDKVIVFPSCYLSMVTNEYHKGEFNPRLKAIVFSWEDFVKGYETKEDNLNLGIHEFAHVLNYHGLKSGDASGVMFSRMYKKINEEVNNAHNAEKLIQSNYFRIYAYTNQFEFLAVILEHYFETPELFKQEFPQLYSNLSIMLNHK
jgi:Mlc titration factor MtfA (ptsG expression regulator)